MLLDKLIHYCYCFQAGARCLCGAPIKPGQRYRVAWIDGEVVRTCATCLRREERENEVLEAPALIIQPAAPEEAPDQGAQLELF